MWFDDFKRVSYKFCIGFKVKYRVIFIFYSNCCYRVRNKGELVYFYRLFRNVLIFCYFFLKLL